ncbi:hypothetical protein NEOLI_002519 [Neolecta irregularis DAH-3]|uniref:Uncharacterized protein n=1 Tax=Neolecta irregularis (strain DAH-3) TaxID=1198029 RepID=A0A1U7LTV6_NEOID|nr:hypothetical protein NEOLI_002519 [Neolecta irregularis DAH-3]|eukprot:OLL26097.1 hypothetical protein NEOLI_002519 [Neolecta irregularis DAH-3]
MMAANQGYSYNPGAGARPGASSDGYLLAPQPGAAYSYVPPPHAPSPSLSPQTASLHSPVLGPRAESERRQIAAVLALNDDLIHASVELAASADRSEAEKASVRSDLLERIAANLQFLTALADRRSPGSEMLPVRPPAILNAPASVPRLAKSYAQLQMLFGGESSSSLLRPQRRPLSPPVQSRHGSFSSSSSTSNNTTTASTIPIHVTTPSTFAYSSHGLQQQQQQQHQQQQQQQQQQYSQMQMAYSQLHPPQNHWTNSGLQ